jgi:hypothetical protein
VTAPTEQLLAWIAERTRSYAETMEAWRTSCPRLSIWEDAVADRLVRVDHGRVELTATGAELLERSATSSTAAAARQDATASSTRSGMSKFA